MLEVAAKLSEDFEYVRVDLYCQKNKIYFGELTFTHNAGFSKFNPEKYNKIWGEYWKWFKILYWICLFTIYLRIVINSII